MPKHGLEAQLATLTQEFVVRLVEAIRNASFAEVAALPAPSAVASTPRRGASARGRGISPLTERTGSSRQTAARRAELGGRIMKALQEAGRPLGVRALASELGVAPDLLTAPIRELRAFGRLRKHGEKRSTTYSTP
jgi:hypothetical protein